MSTTEETCYTSGTIETRTIVFISTRSLFIFLHFVVRVCVRVRRTCGGHRMMVKALFHHSLSYSLEAGSPLSWSFPVSALLPCQWTACFCPSPQCWGLQHSHAGFVSLLHLGSKLRSLCLQNKHICPPGPLPNLHSFVKVDRSRSLVAILCGKSSFP